jgi:hypothetical protein
MTALEAQSDQGGACENPQRRDVGRLDRAEEFINHNRRFYPTKRR